MLESGGESGGIVEGFSRVERQLRLRKEAQGQLRQCFVERRGDRVVDPQPPQVRPPLGPCAEGFGDSRTVHLLNDGIGGGIKHTRLHTERFGQAQSHSGQQRRHLLAQPGIRGFLQLDANAVDVGEQPRGLDQTGQPGQDLVHREVIKRRLSQLAECRVQARSFRLPR
jgi:hypothetical protein